VDPGDGKANPTDLTQSLRKGARTRGARIVEGVQAHGVTTHNGRVSGSRGARRTRRRSPARRGQLRRPVGARVRRRCGVNVPLASAEHFYS
jgi:4-methylaminobutanoate oxidase (formaldehyde-forming)